MRRQFIVLQVVAAFVLTIPAALSARAAETQLPNPLIDYPAFLANAGEVGRTREQRRVSVEQFIEMSKAPGTIVFDARSDDKFARVHIKGARHVSFPDITEAELNKVFPDKATRILIYCNNNFLNAPNSMPSKTPAASLNVHTFNVLFNYGYTNVYELGPLVDIRNTKLPFEGTALDKP